MKKNIILSSVLLAITVTYNCIFGLFRDSIMPLIGTKVAINQLQNSQESFANIQWYNFICDHYSVANIIFIIAAVILIIKVTKEKGE